MAGHTTIAFKRQRSGSDYDHVHTFVAGIYKDIYPPPSDSGIF